MNFIQAYTIGFDFNGILCIGIQFKFPKRKWWFWFLRFSKLFLHIFAFMKRRKEPFRHVNIEMGWRRQLALTKVLILNFSFRKVSIAREVSKIICRKLLNAKYSTKYEIMEKWKKLIVNVSKIVKGQKTIYINKALNSQYVLLRLWVTLEWIKSLWLSHWFCLWVTQLVWIQLPKDHIKRHLS